MRISIVAPILLIAAAACVAKVETSDSGTATPAGTAAAPAALMPADMAGTWTVQVRPMDKDTVLITHEMIATADTTGWTINFAGRPPIPMHIIPSGDSIIGHFGPYESALRKGVTVTTESVIRLVGGKAVGTAKATYKMASGDSVVMLRTEGTRK